VAIAMFSLLSNTLELGADTGLTRTIPRYRALDRTQDLRRSLWVALIPVLLGGTLAAAAVYVFAAQLANVFTHRSDPQEVASLIRTLAFFLPVSSAYTVIIAATRGFGTMVPSVAIDRIGKPALQPILVQLVIWAGLGSSAVALAWAGPIGIGCLVGLASLGILLRRSITSSPRERAPSRGLAELAAEFWGFTAPRALAGMFQVAILWVDTLLIGALRSTREAGIYSAATRYMLVGTFAIIAIIQVFGPKMSELLAHGARDSARAVYQTSTAWLVILTWPVYFTILLFTPLLLSIFGRAFLAGDAPLLVLGGAMLVATACGPVDVVLLMAGKSSWNLINTLVALALNIGLNLILIPRLGITGAGVAWAVSILANNLLPLAESWLALGLHPFGRGFSRAVVASTLSYGGIGLVVRLTRGTSLQAFLLFAVSATMLYGVLLWRLRHDLDLDVLPDVIRRRRASPLTPEMGIEPVD